MTFTNICTNTESEVIFVINNLNYYIFSVLEIKLSNNNEYQIASINKFFMKIQHICWMSGLMAYEAN